MGAGIAKEFAQRYPELPKFLGRNIKQIGVNIPILWKGTQPNILSLPTKHHWMEMSNIDLITNSLQMIKSMADNYKWVKVVLPRPGCSNGGLDWSYVKVEIQPILDNRFFVISND